MAGCRIESVLGRGGMGVVYRARQLSLDRVVALKVIAPDFAMDEEFRERFKHESRLAASIEHANVIPVYEAGETDGLLYLIMRYVEGTDLRTLIATEGALESRRAARLVAQVAAALAAAHRRDLVHRDVKPANVLISADGHAYLTDFGIARDLAATSGLTATGAVVGTLDYIAPERLEHPAGDARSDVYALGCVLYEALTGSVPFPLDIGPAKMFAHVSAPVPSAREVRPEVPASLDELARRSMAKDPDDRPSSASELAEALLVAAAGSAAGAAGSAGAEDTPPAPEPAPETRPAATAKLEEPPTAATEPVGRESATAGGGPGEPEPPRGATRPATPEPSTGGGGPGEPEPPTATRRPVGGEPPTAPARPSGSGARRPPRFAVLAGLAMVAVVGVVGVLALAGGGSDDGDDGDGGSTDGPREGRLSPVALAAVKLSPGADGVAVGEGFVWVADKDANTVSRIDPRTRRKVGETRVGTEPDSIAVGEGAVWVTNTGSDDVSRIDPESFDERRFPAGRAPEGIVVGKGAVWVANQEAGTVTRIDPGGGEARTTSVGRAPIQLAMAPNGIWVTLSGGGAVARLEAETGNRVGDPVRIGGKPRGIAVGGGLLWVSSPTVNEIVVIDPSSSRVLERIEVADDPREVRAGEGGIWVTSAGTSEVTAIDPGSREVAGTVKVRGKPYGLGVGEGLVWAAGLDNGLITPIRPRRR